MRWTLVLWWMSAAACVPSVEVSGDTRISCASTAECPDGWLCNPSLRECQKKLTQVDLPEPALVYVSPADTTPNVVLSPILVIAFSLDVGATSLDGRVRLVGADDTVVGVTRHDTALANTFELTADLELTPLTTYTLVVDAGVEPLSADAAPSSVAYTSSFVTGDAPDVDGPAPVAWIDVDQRTPTTAYLAWQNPSDPDFVGVLVLRREGGEVDGAPEPGRSYGGGATLGSATVVTITSENSYVDVRGHVGRFAYALYAFDALNNYSEVAHAPFVSASTLGYCAGTGSATVSGDGGTFQVVFTPVGSPQTSIVYPPPGTVGTQLDWTDAGLTSGTEYLARIVVSAKDGYFREVPVTYWDLPTSLAPLSVPLPVAPTGLAQLTFTPYGWTSFEAEVDTDMNPGAEAYSSTGVDGAVASAIMPLAGEYRFRVRPTKLGCPAVPWTVSDPFEVGQAVYVDAAGGDDLNNGAGPNDTVKTLVRANNLAVAGTDVFVATGLYPSVGAFALDNDVRYFGGFDADFTGRTLPPEEPTPATSEITADCLGIAGGNTGTVFDGFEVSPIGLCPSTFSTGIGVGSGVTYRNNLVHGGGSAATWKSRAFAAGSLGAMATIEDNVLDDGNSGGESFGVEGGGPITVSRNRIHAVTGIMSIGANLIVDNVIEMSGVDGPNGGNRAGIRVGGTGWIASGNRIGGAGLFSVPSHGLDLLYPGNGRASGNEIFGGGGTPSVGVWIDTVTGELVNNLVHGGTGNGAGDATDVSIAIHNAHNGVDGWSGVVIVNNTLYAGDAPNAMAVHIEKGGRPALANNLFFGPATGWRFILDDNTGYFTPQEPRTIQDNVILALPVAPAPYFQRIGNNVVTRATLGELEALMCTAGGDLAAANPAGGNVEVALQPEAVFADLGGDDDDWATFADNDWRLATTDVAITEGGRDAGTFNCGAPGTGCPPLNNQSCGTVTVDLDGADRTVPMSVGAFEAD